jgi:DNA-binding NtrC family response regulator
MHMTLIPTNGNQVPTISIPYRPGLGTIVADAADSSLDDILATTERQQIVDALRRAGGQRASAARLLRISRSRLYRRMDALGIEPCACTSGVAIG